MTDMTLTYDLRDENLRAFMPLAQATVPDFSRKDVLQHALNGTLAQDTSLEHLFDWWEGRK